MFQHFPNPCWPNDSASFFHKKPGLLRHTQRGSPAFSRSMGSSPGVNSVDPSPAEFPGRWSPPSRADLRNGAFRWDECSLPRKEDGRLMVADPSGRGISNHHREWWGWTVWWIPNSGSFSKLNSPTNRGWTVAGLICGARRVGQNNNHLKGRSKAPNIYGQLFPSI